MSLAMLGWLNLIDTLENMEHSNVQVAMLECKFWPISSPHVVSKFYDLVLLFTTLPNQFHELHNSISQWTLRYVYSSLHRSPWLALPKFQVASLIQLWIMFTLIVCTSSLMCDDFGDLYVRHGFWCVQILILQYWEMDYMMANGSRCRCI